MCVHFPKQVASVPGGNLAAAVVDGQVVNFSVFF